MILAIGLFLAAFLLFLVQPMIAKVLLPWFGGSAAVWTVCLLFFQVLLLAGYVYAHLTRRYLHLLLLAGSLAALPLSAREPDITDPTLAILVVLAQTIGLPYFVLASTSPLLQRWSTLENPYRLYALSNLASLISLAAYPFVIEPFISLTNQLKIWGWGYALFTVLCAAVTWRGREQSEPVAEEPVSWSQTATWLALSGCGTGLLMATTNHMCQEVASIPLLWVVPLVLYLLTFVIVFDRPQWYNRRIYGLLGSISIPIACAFSASGSRFPMWAHLSVYSIGLFVSLMLVHGELSRARPERGSLTRYYVALSAGGALGGVFVALVAPRIFDSYAEFPLLLTAAAGLSVLQRWRDGEFSSYRDMPPIARASLTGLVASTVVPFILLDSMMSTVVAESRNFYGVLRVKDWNDDEGAQRILTHGATTHGLQWLSADKRQIPTTYYSKTSGIGIAIEGHPRRAQGPLKVGVVGLGTGTLAAYARTGDVFRFYEINPEVPRIAKKHFTYLTRAPGKVEIVEGDARISLRDETPQDYDVLAVDAFSSDSIPIHLLTVECGRLYRRHLKPDGRLVIHISNRTLDLAPVVRGLARDLGWSAQQIESSDDNDTAAYSSTWMILTPGPAPEGRAIRWTDDFASILSVWDW